MRRAALAPLGLLVLFAAAWLAAAPAGAPKVVVLGFDGADPSLVRRYMAEGAMPNFARLEKQGGFQDLRVTNPPQTPVSWGAFITGWNPGRNQVFDFLVRDIDTYKPRFALMEEGTRPFLLGRHTTWVLAVAGLLAGLAVGWPAGRLLRPRTGRWARLVPPLLGVVLATAAGAFSAVYLPRRIPDPINHLKGTPFWERAAAAGKRCLVFRVPDTFPAQPYREGRLLSGLGVPDIRGRVGTPYVFTTDPTLTAGDNEFSVDIVPVPRDAPMPVRVTIQGPFNKPFYEYVVDDAGGCSTEPTVRGKLRQAAQERLKAKGVPPTVDVPLDLTWDEASGTCTYVVQDQSATLKPGQWSPWIRFDFALNPLVHVHGLARFYLLKGPPDLRLYLSPIHVHPEDHGIPISYPRNYAERLMERFGVYKTMGWAIDTWTISSGLADEAQFLSDVENTESDFERMMVSLLRDADWDLYVQVYEYTDRVAHILWRYMDEGHPLYDPVKAPAYQDAMRKAYVRMDHIVGEAMEAMPEGAALLVLSDHGFASFRRAVNYNRWLIDHGYLSLKADTGVMTLEDLFDDDRLLFKNVDWQKTQAYALGLGNIYINLKGRERQGIVSPGPEYDALCRTLQEELPKVVDPSTGERAIHAVYRREEIYRNFDPAVVPDLRVTNTPNYRVSWQTSLGGAPESLFETNEKAWSGDHCSLDPCFVPGLLLSNRSLESDPDMLDMAPTILDLLGVPLSPELEGRSLARPDRP